MLALLAFVMVATENLTAASLQAGPQPGTTFRDCPNCPEMVALPAGEFQMGSSPLEMRNILATASFSDAFLVKQHMPAEQPQHPVRINQLFGLGKYLVTRGEFATFVRETGYAPAEGCSFFDNGRYRNHPDGGWQNPGIAQTDRDPVVCVNWQDAQAYVAWLNGKLRNDVTGYVRGTYRLPTEAEWEYGARAGQQTSRWWGDDIGWDNADCVGCGSLWDNKSTAPVGSFRPNGFGLYDILGNAWEWTVDCWNASYDGAPSDGTAWASGSCKERVIRGGGWSSALWFLRSAGRTRFDGSFRVNFGGFRVAKTLPQLLSETPSESYNCFHGNPTGACLFVAVDHSQPAIPLPVNPGSSN